MLNASLASQCSFIGNRASKSSDTPRKSTTKKKSSVQKRCSRDGTVRRKAVKEEGNEYELSQPGWSAGYGTGGKIWTSSKVLLRWMIERDFVRDCDIVEFGCGLGYLGISLVRNGARKVVMTDGGTDALLKLAKDNAKKKNLSESEAKVLRVDWGKALSREVKDAVLKDFELSVIVCADCTYETNDHEALLDTILELIRLVRSRGSSSSTPRIVLAHQHRMFASLLNGNVSTEWGVDEHYKMFLATARQKGFTSREIKTEKLSLNGLRNVTIFELLLLLD
jgi:predicted nicotinamide N-methyase